MGVCVRMCARACVYAGGRKEKDDIPRSEMQSTEHCNRLTASLSALKFIMVATVLARCLFGRNIMKDLISYRKLLVMVVVYLERR